MPCSPYQNVANDGTDLVARRMAGGACPQELRGTAQGEVIRDCEFSRTDWVGCQVSEYQLKRLQAGLIDFRQP